MHEGFSAYEKGLDEKQNLEHDKKAATAKTPAPKLQANPPQSKLAGNTNAGQDPGIIYWKHESIAKRQISVDIPKAISYLRHDKAPTGKWLLGEIKKLSENKSLSLNIDGYFVASLDDLPPAYRTNTLEKGIAWPVSTQGDRWIVYVVVTTSVKTFSTVNGLLVESARLQIDRPECIAETLFHELLHVWFVATYSGYNPILGTGHDPTASITFVFGSKSYQGFDPKFEEKLKYFDEELSKIIGTRICDS